MRIVVVGAGIAGLTLALWLRRVGWDCTVYEQAQEFAPAGAGIQLAPNAVRLLDRVAVCPPNNDVVRPLSLDLRRWVDGSVLASTELGPSCVRRYGAPYLTIHRADLHQALHDAAVQATIPIEFGLRCTSVQVDADRPVMRLDTGEEIEADLVVGADGIWSAVRQALAGEDSVVPRFSGITVHRALVDAELLPRMEARINVWVGPGRHCVWYPVRGGRWYSVVAAAPGTVPSSPRSWREPSTVDELCYGFEDWHPSVRAVLSSAQGVTRWGLYETPPLARWSRGAVTLVGDAANAVLPFGAQGANQAIESAVTLATCLRGVAGRPEVVAAVERYQRLRAPRLERVAASVRRNAADHHLEDGAAQQARDDGLAAGGMRETHDWMFSYDAEAEAFPAGIPADIGGGVH
jgi:salicylate hydroxylase